MTPRQKELVQASFSKVAPIAGKAADLFYDRLFQIDASLRPMFPADMKDQKTKLMQMLSAAVKGLDNLDTLIPVVRQLGARHNGYGVKEEHYATVAAALLWTLERGLGDAFTEETREAWVVVYGILATTMQEGAASGASA